MLTSWGPASNRSHPSLLPRRVCRPHSYDKEIIAGLRRPMVSWLRDNQRIDALDELEDERDEGSGVGAMGTAASAA